MTNSKTEYWWGFFFFKQKTAYEVRISDWSSDVCSSDLLSAPTLQGRAAYLSALMASTTVLGMAALQTQQVVSGKDPRDMTDSRTWIQAIMRGGALSIFGDFLFSDTTQYGNSLLGTVAGPVAGL